jgi:hypothetical protein
MAEIRVPALYAPLPRQQAFRRSRAQFRGFGGAMSGGKTRALCEDVFDNMLDYPGIHLAVARQKHTAIVDTTRKSSSSRSSRPSCARATISCGSSSRRARTSSSSAGTAQRSTFYGLDDPGKFFSAEYGGAYVDEAHEVDEDSIITINSRLRQRCPDCHKAAASFADMAEVPPCEHYPHTLTMTFNPSFPGHWLHEWFILGAHRTEFGYRKDELYPTGSEHPIGDCEFIPSKATDNKYVSRAYIEQNLGGMPELQRRRYLEGEWLHISGTGFFDQEGLSRLMEIAGAMKPILVGEAAGDVSGKPKLPTLMPKRNGRLEVFKPPVRLSFDQATGNEIQPHAYVLGIDTSSGMAADFSGIQVIDVQEWEQVAEWQGKVDPDKLAEIAFLIGCVYNGAMLAPEITGGWGFAVVRRLQRLLREWAGPPKAKPRLYTRPVLGKISDKFTDALGWDTNQKTRAHSLALLEEGIADGSAGVYGLRTLAELAAFAFPDYKGTGDYGKPQARKGQHDDLVMPLAIAFAVAEKMPRKPRQAHPDGMAMSGI